MGCIGQLFIVACTHELGKFPKLGPLLYTMFLWPVVLIVKLFKNRKR